MQNHSIWISYSYTQLLWWWVANPCCKQGFESTCCELEIGIVHCQRSHIKGLLITEWKKPWKLLKNFSRTWKLFNVETYIYSEAYWYFLYLTGLLSYFLLYVGHHFGIIVRESSHQKLSESAKSSQKLDLQVCKTFFFFFLPNFLWESCIIVVKVVYCQQSCCYGFNRTLVIMDSWSCDQNVHFNKLLFIFGSLPK